MKKNVLIIILIFVLNIIFAEVYEGKLIFDESKVSLSANKGYDLVTYNDSRCWYEERPGAPKLPRYSFSVAVPSGAKINSITIDDCKYEIIDMDFYAYPIQYERYPGSEDENFVRPIQRIYTSDKLYPYGKPIRFQDESIIRGYQLFNFSLNLFRLNPVRKKLWMIKEISYTIHYEINEEKAVRINSNHPDNSSYNYIAAEMVVNPGMVPLYVNKKKNLKSGTSNNKIDMLIVTNDELKPAFVEYAKMRKELTGLNIAIITTQNIYKKFSADGYNSVTDKQIKIKKAIHSYYLNNSIDYVLLGGDETVIPDKDCYIRKSSEEKDLIYNDNPTDLFYACFDEQFDWDANGNKIVGEEYIDKADHDPEVIIGRLPVTKIEEVKNYQQKVETYYNKLCYQSGRMEKLLLSGVLIKKYASGKSDAEIKYETLYKETIKNNWKNVDKKGFYDTTPGVYLTKNELVNEFSKGYNVALVYTHGGADAWNMEPKLETPGADNFTSENVNKITALTGMIYTGACSTNWFDQKDITLAESFVLHPKYGSLIYIGASRQTYMGGHEAGIKKFLIEYLKEREDKFCHIPGFAFMKYKQFEKKSWLDYTVNFLGDPSLEIFTEKYTHNVDSTWHFDNSLRDAKNQQNAVLGKGPFNVKYTSGKQGRANYFYNHVPIYVPNNHEKLNIGINDFSISCWIKTNSSQSMMTILDKRENKNSYQIRGYHLLLYKGKLLLQLADDSGHQNFWGGSQDTNLLNDGKWHFITVTVDRDNPNGIKFYVDSKLIFKKDPTGKQGNLSNNSPLYIGKHIFKDDYDYIGYIDELSIVSRIYSQKEIKKQFVTKYKKINIVKDACVVYDEKGASSLNYGDLSILLTTVNKGNDGNDQYIRSYLEADISNIPSDAKIVESTLNLYQIANIPPNVYNPLTIHRNTTPWYDDSISWAVQPEYKVESDYPYNCWNESYIQWLINPVVLFDKSKDLADNLWSAKMIQYIDIKDFVQGWVNKSVNNYGLMLRYFIEEQNVDYYFNTQMTFGSSENNDSLKRPVVEVRYYLPSDL